MTLITPRYGGYVKNLLARIVGDANVATNGDKNRRLKCNGGPASPALQRASSMKSIASRDIS
jgi:hypothetical protein